MDKIGSKDCKREALLPARKPLIGFGRREFLASTASALGGLLLGSGAAPRGAAAQGVAAPAVSAMKFSDWGWPQPYEQDFGKIQTMAAKQGMVAA